jgi:hypothetical protein
VREIIAGKMPQNKVKSMPFCDPLKESKTDRFRHFGWSVAGIHYRVDGALVG